MVQVPPKTAKPYFSILARVEFRNISPSSHPTELCTYIPMDCSSNQYVTLTTIYLLAPQMYYYKDNVPHYQLWQIPWKFSKLM